MPPLYHQQQQSSTAHPDPRPDAAAAIRHPVPVFVDQTKVSYTYNDYQETAAAVQTRRLGVGTRGGLWLLPLKRNQNGGLFYVACDV